MGSLSNLYISNSFQSLIHLGTDGTASANSIQLEDGLGNGISVYVNTSGHVSASAFSGSVNGIGNVTSYSSSVSSRLTTQETFSSSFTTFSTSVDSRLDTLESFSSSADSRYVQNSQTSSMAVSSSTYAVTSSYAEFAVTASEARNLIVIARNGNQSTLSAGTVVHITSAVGDNPIFNTASFDTELLSANTLGIVRTAVNSGSDCEVVVNGIVTGVNTDPTLGYAAGDVVYLSSSGQFTRIQPQAPDQIVVLGQVLRAQQNQGSLYVSINNGWELDELHNVQINTPLTNDLLAYESSSYGLWKNKSFSSLGLATTASVNSLSASIFETDATQSLNISANSSSIGLLQTFSGSQYKNDSSSFDSRINSAGGQLQIQDEGSILGNATSLNFTGSGVSVSISSGTGSVVILGGGGGGSDFPYTGSAIISGSLIVTGSQYGNVVALTVSSGTASLDMSLGNSFTLTLPSSSTTVIDATNIRAGATINLLITQPATSGAVSFTSEFKFQNGVDYQASATGSAIDLLSFATFDTTSVYATAIKNLF